MNSARILTHLGVAAIFLCASGIAIGASAPSTATSSHEINVAAAHAERKAAVSNNMKLTPAEAKAFWPLYDQYEAAMDKIEARHIKEVHDYALHYATLTDADAKAKLDEVIVIQQSVVDTQKEYVPKFRAAISQIKTTRFFQIDNKLRALVQCDLAQAIPLARRGGTQPH